MAVGDSCIFGRSDSLPENQLVCEQVSVLCFSAMVRPNHVKYWSTPPSTLQWLLRNGTRSRWPWQTGILGSTHTTHLICIDIHIYIYICIYNVSPICCTQQFMRRNVMKHLASLARRHIKKSGCNSGRRSCSTMPNSKQKQQQTAKMAHRPHLHWILLDS